MTKPIHLLMPMSGQGTRFRAAGYDAPKPLIEVNGTPMVERLLSSFPEHWPSFFVMAQNHAETGLPKLLQRLRPRGTQYFMAPNRRGPSFAALQALSDIPDDAPVFVSYCDYGMQWDNTAFERFVRATNCDVAVVSYRGFHAHYLTPQMYAYSRLEGDRIAEVREKGCFTSDREQEFASAGGYYFRRADLLKRGVAAQERLGLTLNGELYTSLTIQALLQTEPALDARVFEVPGFFQWGTPADMERFAYWERSIRALLARPKARGHVAQVLMPMAGAGSRFAGLTPLPKPLIPVGDHPMFVAALNTLPTAAHTAVVALQAFAPAVKEALSAQASSHRVVTLEATPSGQALSTEAGIGALALDEEVLVTACDHGICTPAETWDALRADAGCDAAIFTMTGYPGARATPKAYAYVHSEQGVHPFPQVTAVSVKQPISETPQHDPVLVGTFWFRSAQVLADAIAALKDADIRVNGELYLDSVFELLIARGTRVSMVPLQAFVCWGDPDVYAEATYYQEQHSGHIAQRRRRFPNPSPHKEPHAAPL